MKPQMQQRLYSTNEPHRSSPTTLSLKRVLVCTAAILTLSMGIRHGFGLWLQPITQERGWTR